MGPKIEVKDRVSTYPGRVVLTPVSGAENTYDMVRADAPTVEGTPINKALLDNKAYTLKENITLYVSTAGSNSGDGSAAAPFNTIQKAIDAIPKHLGAHTATIDITAGTYEEKITIEGFSSGRLIVGVPGRNVTVRQIRIESSSFVEVNISNVTYSASFAGTLFVATQNSNVILGSNITFEGNEKGVSAIEVTDNSSLSTEADNVVTVSNCYNAAIAAINGSHITLDTVQGTNNSMGLVSTRGSVFSYHTHTLEGAWGDVVSYGSLMMTGGNSSEFVNSTVV